MTKLKTVSGLVLTPDKKMVALRLDKNDTDYKFRPVGGETLQNENTLDAIVRIFNKETEKTIPKHDWELAFSVKNKIGSHDVYVAYVDNVDNDDVFYVGVQTLNNRKLTTHTKWMVDILAEDRINLPIFIQEK